MLRVSKNRSFAAGVGSRPSIRVCVCADVTRHLWDSSFTLQQCEKKGKRGWFPVFLTIPGCVYIKSTLAVSGNGKISAGLTVYRHWRIRAGESFSRWPFLSWKTLRPLTALPCSSLTRWWRYKNLHSQMFKMLFFPLFFSSVAVWNAAACTEDRFG